MEELLGVFLGFALATVASVSLARHQQRHETRVRILRDILPRIQYPLHALPEELFALVDDLVTAAIVLRRDERMICDRIYAVFDERGKMQAVPGPVDAALIPAQQQLAERHRELVRGLQDSQTALKVLIGKRLRWVGRLTDTEKKALGVSTD